MDTISISKYKLKKYPRLKIDNSLSCESKIYINPQNYGEVFKIFNCNPAHDDLDKLFLNNKLYTINELYALKDKELLDYLVLPLYRISVDDYFMGYAMQRVKGQTFRKIFQDSKVAYSDKKEALKKLGESLEKLKAYRQKYNSSLYLSDLHEDNVLLDSKKEIKIIDIDSVSIGSNTTPPSLYYYYQKRFANLSDKYPFYDYNIIPNDNSEIYCYIMVILSFITKNTFGSMQMDTYYKYLEYLYKNGVDNNLLSALYRIYEKDDNINPYPFLDCLSEDIDYSFEGFQKTLR